MAQHKKRRIAVFLVYFLLIAGIAWQTFALVEKFGPQGKYSLVRSYKVAVNGDVRRPGLYRVPEGATQFEILKVAGVRPTSDLSALNLMSAMGENGELTVGSREAGVDVRPQPVVVRVEYFYGDIAIFGKDGRSVPTQEGIALSQGDRVQTDLSSQVELSLGTFSRVDMDAFAELSFDKIVATEGDRVSLELFQKMGACWYKIAYTAKNESYKITTPATQITIAGTGADFLIDLQPDQTTINLMDGQLTLDRSNGTESISMITGQTATVYNDGRPIQVSRLAPDMSASERFTQLSQEKKGAVTRGQPMSFLFCGTPAVFFVVSAQFDKGAIYTLPVPPRLLVGQFAQGIQTLDEAYLYGGPLLVTSLLERILNIRLSRFMVFSKDNILKTADVFGGITIKLDNKGATLLKKTAGPQKLTSQNLATFLSPAGSSPEESEIRQRQVLDALFNGMRDKSIVLTTVTTGQLLSMIQSNFSTEEVMDYYLRLTTTATISERDLKLPVKEQRIKGRLSYEPDLEKCRALIEGN
jgi:hypothetical protein